MLFWVVLLEVINLSVDISSGLQSVLQFIISSFNNIINLLDSIFIFPHVSVLSFFIALVVIGMLISSIFVIYNGDVDD